MAFTWAPVAGRFRDAETGRFVSEAAVRAGVDALADLSSARLAQLAAQFRAGELTAQAWLTAHLADVKSVHVAAALAAYGGREQMTPARWGLVGHVLRREYAYARAMVADVLDGRQRMSGRLDARAALYGQAARVTYENVRRRQEHARGSLWERNDLHASESCAHCRAQSALGQVPIGTLVPIGSRTCRSNCRCTISFSAAREPLAS